MSYNAGMEAIGLLYLFILFGACLAVIYIVKMAWIGFKSSRKQRPEKNEPPKEQPKEAPKPQPVYYIVEKKRSKKANYSAPREIKFTDEK